MLKRYRRDDEGYEEEEDDEVKRRRWERRPELISRLKLLRTPIQERGGEGRGNDQEAWFGFLIKLVRDRTQEGGRRGISLLRRQDN